MPGFSALQVPPNEVPGPELDPPVAESGLQRSVLAGGCFWCTEAVFKQLDGVVGVRAGYAGGTAETANYYTVSSGATDHAEAVEITYDPTSTSYGLILKVFFTVAHDPTQINRQGNDRGRQYRSAVFCNSDMERHTAAAYIRQLDAAGVFSAPIKTIVEPLDIFYEAEAAHQDYATRYPLQPYIVQNTQPKIEGLHKYFCKPSGHT